MLNNDSIGRLRLRKGSYRITLVNRGLSCPRATQLFRSFLQDFDGTLPRPWRLDGADRHFHPRSQSQCGIPGEADPLTESATARPAGHTLGHGSRPPYGRTRHPALRALGFRLRAAARGELPAGHARLRTADGRQFIAELLEARARTSSRVRRARGWFRRRSTSWARRPRASSSAPTRRPTTSRPARARRPTRGSQRAEREAEILRRDADEYAEQVIVDTRAAVGRAPAPDRGHPPAGRRRAGHGRRRDRAAEAPGADRAHGGRRRPTRRRLPSGPRSRRSRRRGSRADRAVQAGHGCRRAGRACPARGTGTHGRARGPAGRLRGSTAARTRLTTATGARGRARRLASTAG